jgi:hypothetical protein
LLWIHTSDGEDHFLHLDKLDAYGITQCWHEKYWGGDEKQFVKRKSSISFKGVTNLTVSEISKIGE